MSHPLSCPCKTLPLRSSSFTLASYGVPAPITSASLHRHPGPFNALKTDDDGKTALHYAAQWDRANLVLSLCDFLRRGNDVSNGDGTKNSLQSSIMFTSSSSGVTPLHAAASSGASESLKIMLSYCRGLDALYREDGRGETVVMKAVKEGRWECLNVIIDYFALRRSSSSSSSSSSSLRKPGFSCLSTLPPSSAAGGGVSTSTSSSLYNKWRRYVSEWKSLHEVNVELGCDDAFNKPKDYAETVRIIEAEVGEGGRECVRCDDDKGRMRRKVFFMRGLK